MNTSKEDRDRYLMWCALIPGWERMSRNEKKHAKDYYAKEKGLKPHMITSDQGGTPEYLKEAYRKYAREMSSNTANSNQVDGQQAPMIKYITGAFTKTAANSLDCFNVPCTSIVVNDQEKKGKNMYFEFNDDENHGAPTDQVQRSYLNSRLVDASSDKTTPMQRAFGLRDDNEPSSFNDLVDRLNNGKFMISDENKNRKSYNPLAYVTWRDPSIKRDEPGYEKASKEKEAAETETRDTIMIQPPEQGLAALKAFEGRTFH